MNLIVDFLIDYYGPIPYLTIFVILLLCGLGVPIPEDLILIAAGILTYYGVCDIWTMIAVCLVGVLIGDTFVFYLGHHFGRKLIKKRPFRYFLDENKIDEYRSRLKNHTGKVLFSARFMPGLRSTVFFASGMLHIPYRKLLTYDGGAALISVPAIVYSVYYFGDFLEQVIRYIKKIEGGLATTIVVVAALLIFNYIRKKKKAKHAHKRA